MGIIEDGRREDVMQLESLSWDLHKALEDGNEDVAELKARRLITWLASRWPLQANLH